MQPRVVAAIAALACILGTGAPASAQTPAFACMSGGRAVPNEKIVEFRKTMEDSFLFKTLQRRVGPPLSCRVDKLDPPNILMAWLFAQGATFTVHTGSETETVSHTAMMPGLSDGEALELLKAGAKEFTSPECGIDWNKPVREKGADDVTYRGPSCNCYGRINYRDKKVTGLSLGLAC